MDEKKGEMRVAKTQCSKKYCKGKPKNEPNGDAYYECRKCGKKTENLERNEEIDAYQLPNDFYPMRNDVYDQHAYVCQKCFEKQDKNLPEPHAEDNVFENIQKNRKKNKKTKEDLLNRKKTIEIKKRDEDKMKNAVIRVINSEDNANNQKRLVDFVRELQDKVSYDEDFKEEDAKEAIKEFAGRKERLFAVAFIEETGTLQSFMLKTNKKHV